MKESNNDATEDFGDGFEERFIPFIRVHQDEYFFEQSFDQTFQNLMRSTQLLKPMTRHFYINQNVMSEKIVPFPLQDELEKSNCS